MCGIVESKREEPKPINSTAKPAYFEACERASGSTQFCAVPFMSRIADGESVGYLANNKKALQKREGVRGRGSGDVNWLGGVVGHESDGVREGTELVFGCEVEEGETVG